MMIKMSKKAKNKIITRESPKCATCGTKVGWYLGSQSPSLKEGTWQFGYSYFCSKLCMNAAPQE